MSNLFLARQPIFDRDQNVWGYEILYRSGQQNVFTGGDGDSATSHVIDGTLHAFGIGALTSGKRAFINITRNMLVQGLVSVLPPETSVLEILETVKPDDEVLAACIAMKHAGYTIALDDYSGHPEMEPLAALADIIKVDFKLTKGPDRGAMAKRYIPRGIKLLAEKVETRQEVAEAIDQGYVYFQGYFFCKPEMISRKEIPPYKLSYLRFLSEVNRPEVDFDDLERVVMQDVSLSLKLLRYINSAMFGLRTKVESIKKALLLLGLLAMKRWVSLLALTEMGNDKPEELIVTSLVRARFCEQLGLATPSKDRVFDLFMIGMLSAVDALLDRPMAEVLAELPLDAEITDVLLGKTDGLGRIYVLALAYERGEWEHIPALAEALGIPAARLTEIYSGAVEWADQIFKIQKQG